VRSICGRSACPATGSQAVGDVSTASFLQRGGRGLPLDDIAHHAGRTAISARDSARQMECKSDSGRPMRD
jgi:hypothetical protein